MAWIVCAVFAETGVLGRSSGIFGVGQGHRGDLY